MLKFQNLYKTFNKFRLCLCLYDVELNLGIYWCVGRLIIIFRLDYMIDVTVSIIMQCKYRLRKCRVNIKYNTKLKILHFKCDYYYCTFTLVPTKEKFI